MNRFYAINKHKLSFAIKATSITFLAIGSVIFLLVGMKEGFPPFLETLGFLLVFGVGFPAMILIVAYLEWRTNDRKRRRLLSYNPYDNLSKLGFKQAYFNESTKWFFTQYTLEGIVDGFRIKFDVEHVWTKKAMFIALAYKKHQIPIEDKIIIKELAEHNIELHHLGLKKTIKLKRNNPINIIQLSAELVEFTSTVREYGFVPNNFKKE